MSAILWNTSERLYSNVNSFITGAGASLREKSIPLLARIIPDVVWHRFFYLPLEIIGPIFGCFECILAFLDSFSAQVRAFLLSSHTLAESPIGKYIPLILTVFESFFLHPVQVIIKKAILAIRATDCNALATMQLRYLMAGDKGGTLCVDEQELQLGRVFITAPMRFVFDCVRQRDPYNVILNASHGSTAAVFIGRVNYLDNLFEKSIKNEEIKQWILLGAGYDTRAWRFADLRKTFGVNVVELDVPAVQARKLQLFKKYFTDSNILEDKLHDVEFVSQSLDNDDGLVSILKDKIKKNVPTLILLEGVTWYLSKPAFESTLRSIKQLRKIINSKIKFVFDVATDEYLNYMQKLNYTDRNRFVLSLSIGLNPISMPISTGDENDAVVAEMNRFNMRVTEVWKSQNFAKKYQRNFHLHPLEFQFITCEVLP